MQLVSKLIRNCKITNQIFESFVQILLEKNIRCDQVKCLKWLIYDLSALKLAQPNPWFENYKFL